MGSRLDEVVSDQRGSAGGSTDMVVRTAGHDLAIQAPQVTPRASVFYHFWELQDIWLWSKSIQTNLAPERVVPLP